MGTPAIPAEYGTNQDHFSAFLAAAKMLMDDENPTVTAVDSLLAHLLEVVAGVQFNHAAINSPGGDELDEFLTWAENLDIADETTAELVKLLRQSAI